MLVQPKNTKAHAKRQTGLHPAPRLVCIPESISGRYQKVIDARLLWLGSRRLERGG